MLLAPSVTAQNGDMEGIPVALMEAMAQGTPVLSTWHSGIPELIEHGVVRLLGCPSATVTRSLKGCSSFSHPRKP